MPRDRAIARQFTPVRRRLLAGPNPMTQTVLWGLVVVIVVFSGDDQVSGPSLNSTHALEAGEITSPY